MNIENAKDLINKLYFDSLHYTFEDVINHPIRILEASKSIIGINPKKPITKLLDYCQQRNLKIKSNIIDNQFSKLQLPEVVTILDLELSLLKKDKKKSFINIYYLTKVSDGIQILEFLLEFSLRYCSKTYFLIWSVYRMQLFLGSEHILKSLIFCVEYIVKDIQYKRENKSINIDKYIFENSFSPKSFHDIFTLYRISKEEFTRSMKIYPIIGSQINEFNKEDNVQFETKLLENQNKLGRIWIHRLIEKINENDLNDELILNLDVARGCIKILDSNKRKKIVWSYLNEKL